MLSPLISLWSGAIVLVVCLLSSFMLAFTTWGSEIISGEKRQWMAFIFGAYAVFRGIRISQTIKKIKQNEENNR